MGNVCGGGGIGLGRLLEGLKVLPPFPGAPRSRAPFPSPPTVRLGFCLGFIC